MTEECRCHGCKHVLDPEENSTTVEVKGKSVTLCDPCWSKAVCSGKTDFELQELLAPVVSRAMNISHKEGTTMPNIHTDELHDKEIVAAIRDDLAEACKHLRKKEYGAAMPLIRRAAKLLQPFAPDMELPLKPKPEE